MWDCKDATDDDGRGRAGRRAREEENLAFFAWAIKAFTIMSEHGMFSCLARSLPHIVGLLLTLHWIKIPRADGCIGFGRNSYKLFLHFSSTPSRPCRTCNKLRTTPIRLPTTPTKPPTRLSTTLTRLSTRLPTRLRRSRSTYLVVSSEAPSLVLNLHHPQRGQREG